MRLRFAAIIVIITALYSCHTTKKTTAHLATQSSQTSTDSLSSVHNTSYQASNTRAFDLIHTKLEVNFDWTKCQMNGNATLTLHPFFYASNQLILDAQEFDIHEVALLTKSEKKKINYVYDRKKITLTLDKEYKKTDTLQIFISYTANPNAILANGSKAITDRKGLYFINPDGSDPNKPKQLWTQGETQSNSCWFPTIDSPNERMTQEIYLTVDKKYVTLSNGLLIYSKENADGTRTDYWKQNLPAAPYLSMMAVGDFAIVKDSWRDIDVNYYVDPEYEKYAKLIFGHTPEMLEFFSTKLGVDYPWEKFSQIVVHDYVSGAMENTSAVLHGDMLLLTDRKYLDESNEDVIAHELFHHWFGDLVTCESWSNIPLNESFATYGEYLWEEYKYGKEEADHHIQGDLFSYLREAKEKKFPLIRYTYDDREDLFDNHTYEKGGRILHMLRNYVGDEAFFKALNLYLTQNKFKSAEAANLRLAFEEVTGEDLNWFFNQWFFSPGHPELAISYSYNESEKEETLSIHQTQDTKKFPVYKLPIAIDIYANGKTERHKITIDQAHQNFTFSVNSKPDLVNVDADKMLLCTKQDDKKEQEWIFQYYNAPLYFDRYEAIYILGEEMGVDSLSEKVIHSGLTDKYWYIRELAVKYCAPLLTKRKNELEAILSHIAITDEKSEVRNAALSKLEELFPQDTSLMALYIIASKDQSYLVSSEALIAISTIDSLKGLSMAKELEKENDKFNDISVAYVYSKFADSTYYMFFESAIKRCTDHGDKVNLANMYGIYLSRQIGTQIINTGIHTLANEAKTDPIWWVKLYSYYSLTIIKDGMQNKEKMLGEQLAQLKKNKRTPTEAIAKLSTELQNTIEQRSKLDEVLTSIRTEETNKKVKAYYGEEQ